MSFRWLASFALLFACQEKLDHPPFIETCEPGQHCPLPIGFGSSGSPDSGGGEAGATGGSTELKGTIEDFVDDTFDNALPYTDPAVVEGVGANGKVVSTLWNGAEPFVLEGIESRDLSWVSVRPQTGLLNLRTLHPVATNVRKSVELGMVRADVIDGMFLQLAIPKQRAAGAVQVVLFFSVTKAGVTKGVTGVTAFASLADFTAYNIGGNWGIDPPRTDASGLAVLGNVPAQIYPGNKLRITLGGTASGFIDVGIAADAVTLVEVPLSP